MARVELAPGVLDDLDRFVAHMESFGADDEIIAAIDVLGHSPHMGRPVRGGKRELVVGTGTRGYDALYRYVAPIDTVFVLAVRAQREARFQRRRSR